MAQEVSPHSEMAQARQSDGISVIFDKKSPVSARCRARSRSRSRTSRRWGIYRGRYRSSSSSSSSSSRSTSRSSRSRSHPRCHRNSSQCRCRNHHRYSRSYHRCCPPCRHRPRSRSYSRSPSMERSSYKRNYSYRYSRVNKYRCQFSRSHPKSFRERSRSRSSEGSIALSLEEKSKLLKAAKENAMKMLGVKTLERPKSVKPILCEESVQSDHGTTGPEARVRRDLENAKSQTSEMKRDYAQSLKLSPKKVISFSVNNSVAKPTAAAPSSAKVTSLVDSIESKKPYGHWIPVKSVRH